MKPELNSPDLHVNPSSFPCISNTSCIELHQDKKLIFQPITASALQLIGYFVESNISRLLIMYEH